MYRRDLTEKESILATLKVSQIFKNIPVELYSHITDVAKLHTFKEGHSIWKQGDESTNCTIIKRGVVYIQRKNATRSNILGLFGPHESVGLAAALSNIPYPAWAMPFTSEVQVVQFPIAVFQDLLKKVPEVQTSLNQILLSFNKALREKIDILSAGSVETRIISLLTYLAERFGDIGEDNTTIVPLSITRAQIAELVDARVETVIRTMSQWQKNKMIVTHDDSIMIHEWPTL